MVEWNATSRPTVFVSESRLNATIYDDDLLFPSIASISVDDGNTTSNTLPFEIESPSGLGSVVLVASVSETGQVANATSNLAAVSANGRYVAYASFANNLVASPSNVNGDANIYVRDTCAGAVEPCSASTSAVSLSPDGLGNANSSETNGSVSTIGISDDGRYIAFESDASNLTDDLVSGDGDIFLRDTCAGSTQPCNPSTTLVSMAQDGGASNGASTNPSISADGRFVAFESASTNLVSGITGPAYQVYVRDTCRNVGAGCTPSTMLISVGDDGGPGDNLSFEPSISASGRYVAFTSYATNLIQGKVIYTGNVYIRDTCAATTSACVPSMILVSGTSGGAPGNAASLAPSISSNGRYVAFTSLASNLSGKGATGDSADILVKDTCLDAQVCTPQFYEISAGRNASTTENTNAHISGDGNIITYESAPLSAGGIPDASTVVIQKICVNSNGTCVPATTTAVGNTGDAPNSSEALPALSRDGHVLAFQSSATNLVSTPVTNGLQVFVGGSTY